MTLPELFEEDREEEEDGREEETLELDRPEEPTEERLDREGEDEEEGRETLEREEEDGADLREEGAIALDAALEDDVRADTDGAR